MYLLPDPNKTRKVKALPLPLQRTIPLSKISHGKKNDCKSLQVYLKKQGKISKSDFLLLIKTVMNIIKSEPNVINVDDPITIVGDIHGQFYDFCHLISADVGGQPSQTKYLFLGDYVDRGSFFIQVLILLLSLKICHPKSVIMLRGNHQCRQLTSYFNFRIECLHKYDQQIYNIIMEMFDALPLACIINGKFFCLHGGISSQLVVLNDIKKIDRFREIPVDELFCDLMWADPIVNKNGSIQSLVTPNTARGCSYYFGSELSHKFLQKNKLISIIRGHEAQADGFKMYNWRGSKQFPMVITIFSAPNYCDYYKNKGAVIKFLNSTLTIQQFVQSPHPYLLPHFLDLFGLSIPFVIEKVTAMFLQLIKPRKKSHGMQMPCDWMTKTQTPCDWSTKAKYFQKMQKQYKQIMKKNLQLTKLQGYCPDDKLLQTGKFIETSSKNFEQKKIIDSKNQSRPMNQIKKQIRNNVA